jgi:hypothetical protein
VKNELKSAEDFDKVQKLLDDRIEQIIVSMNLK